MERFSVPNDHETDYSVLNTAQAASERIGDSAIGEGGEQTALKTTGHLMGRRGTKECAWWKISIQNFFFFSSF